MDFQLRAYDMRKLVHELSSDDMFAMAYLKKIEGTYYPVFVTVTHELMYISQNKIALKDASEKGLLFGYCEPKILNEFLPQLAEQLNETGESNLKDALFSTVSEFNSNAI